MCRWAAYIGPEVYLEEVVSAPGQSLIAQSLHARECKSGTNGDGFGVAWYGERPEPGLFRAVLPAWSDPNLRAIAHQVRSRLFLAHVRASTGAATSRNNCHPFVVGRWSFMHNGQVGGYDRLRRRIDMMIPESLYDFRKGATDSEALFLLALAEGLERDPKGAYERAVGQLEALSRASGATRPASRSCFWRPIHPTPPGPRSRPSWPASPTSCAAPVTSMRSSSCLPW